MPTSVANHRQPRRLGAQGLLLFTYPSHRMLIEWELYLGLWVIAFAANRDWTAQKADAKL